MKTHLYTISDGKTNTACGKYVFPHATKNQPKTTGDIDKVTCKKCLDHIDFHRKRVAKMKTPHASGVAIPVGNTGLVAIFGIDKP